MRQYITTAIDYPNAAPHMGHVLEKVLADVCARWMRLRGDEVRFQIGTDEHGTKIQRKAESEGVTPKELVDTNVKLFEDLYDRLHLSHDVFIRTSDQKTHWPTVQALWAKLREAGSLEKRSYSGLYCSGCERFITEKELVDGLCVDHQVAPEKVTEENWFFLLSKEGDWLKSILSSQTDGYHIVPDFRAKETLMLIEGGLQDVSFSRPLSSLSWGVPVPDDADQTMYVWCDALTNYISGLDYFGCSEQEACDERGDGVSRLGVQWWDEATVTHVIGKDIARFHALIWPAMLKAAGINTPDTLLIHGFLTSDGQKMSKSLGNVIAPDDVLAKVHGNPDPLRFYLSHEVPVGRDGDFSWERFEEIYNALLRNKLGNLLNRVLVLLQKEGGGIQIESTPEERDSFQQAWTRYEKSLNDFAVHEGVKQVMQLVDVLNAGMDTAQPWKLQGDEKRRVLSHFAESLRHIALMLLPFVPQTAQEISTQLAVPYAQNMGKKEFSLTADMKQFGGLAEWKSVGNPRILFPPFEEAAGRPSA